MGTETVSGQESWHFASPSVEAWVTRTGGMLGPVRFDLGGIVVEPFSVAPWCEESVQPEVPLLSALRGDFFCMPFGGSEEPYLGEVHPLHGEPANGAWSLDALRQDSIDLIYECKIRPGRVFKSIRLGDGVVYQRHTVIGAKGPMSFGHHAMVKFRSNGLVGMSPQVWGQVFPGQFEDPAEGGYTSLEAGAEFGTLSRVPLANGGTSDLTEYPAREGFEDLVQVAADPKERLAWAAVTFPDESYVYFQFKDPRALTGTVLWFSNGGRHYKPWSGRHRAVLGIEEVTSYFHFGLRGSVAPNPLSRTGISTYRDLDPSDPLEIRVIQGVARTPEGFDRVKKVVETGSGVVLVSESGSRLDVKVDLLHLGLP